MTIKDRIPVTTPSRTLADLAATATRAEVDAYRPDRRLAVELDSRRHHLTPHAFERDRRRDADLHRHGIATLRFTYAQITRDPRWVAQTLA